MEFSHRLDLFGPEIFAALNDKKVALEAEGRHLFNLSVGTPDFAPADHIKQALIDAARDNENWKYSLRDLPELLDAVCSYYKRRFDVDTITPNKVMSFSGSQDGIGHLGLALCNDGDVVLLPDPCYPVFMTGSKLGGADPWYYKLTKENHFLPDVTATVLIFFSKSPETRKKGVPSIFLQCSAKSPNLIAFSSLPYRPKPADESSVCWSSILTSVSSNISASLSFIPPLAVSILV